MLKKNNLLFVFILFFLTSSSLFSLNLYPTVVELSLSPNTIKTGYYTVQNTSSEKIKINVEPETYYGANINNWLKIFPSSLILNPNASEKIYYIVNTKKNLKSENCAHIYFKKSPMAQSAAGMGIIVRMGSSFYLSEKGKELISPEFKNIKITRQKNKLFLKLLIKNAGNVHLRFFYKISIYNKKNKEIYKNSFEHLTVVIPGAEKSLSIPLKIDKKLDAGKYSAAVLFAYGNTMEKQSTEKKDIKFIIRND